MEQTENVKKFLEEYELLTKKYGVDFLAYPVFAPDGSGGWKVQCQAMPMEMKEGKATVENFIPKNG